MISQSLRVGDWRRPSGPDRVIFCQPPFTPWGRASARGSLAGCQPAACV